ncbi:PEBP-like protein [Gymnopus androsaceus JB14]|uniref:PEBP-like protein n=1 Tax=Gymnopus androsaceus JB14 TaxID=1447944 RepID=A0A6A4I4Z8_9AGAR|nr:PEBP-like protein [Gymnopus androsaceus JB14]
MPSAISVSTVKQAFGEAGVVPDVTTSFSPVALLDVAYTSANSPIYVNPGGNLTTPQTENIPSFWLTYNNASLVNETFVLAMVDPDAPTPQNKSLAQIRHLILGDLHLEGSASSGTALLVNSTPALSDYISPGPPNGSDPHRYTLLLYVQPSGFQQIAPTLVNASTPITSFNLTSFVEVVGLGTPIAGTFFFEGPFNGSTTSAESQKNGVMERNIGTGLRVGVAIVIGAALVLIML